MAKQISRTGEQAGDGGEETIRDPILEAQSITKHFGDLLVFKDISFCVDRGEFVTLLGPSGCGKSTILHVLSGLLTPDSGKVFLHGEDVTGESGHVSYMQQKDLLLPWRKIIDNVILPLRIQGVNSKEAKKEAEPLLKDFGLGGFEYSYPSQLSGGMRQRAALLRTYLFSKEVLLLDEPFAKLDAITKRRLHSWFIEVLESLESTVFFVTHDIEEALKLSDRMYILSPRPAQIVKEITVRPRPSSQCRPQREDREVAGRPASSGGEPAPRGTEDRETTSKPAGRGPIRATAELPKGEIDDHLKDMVLDLLEEEENGVRR
jgi:ABC-type nitrate/sulfonate/bicarbonate transport system ATPase subunit